MEGASRYLIGIDLGTTNTCVAYVDMDPEKNPGLFPKTFPLLQRVDEERLEARPFLPSACYLVERAHDLPWVQGRDYEVGSFAVEQGARIPSRWVRSAKSWLCHSGSNRRDQILPLEAAEGRRISPVEASAAYLRHVREAWNHQMKEDFDEQEVVLTVPASFDEVARKLTVEAAEKAGFTRVTLLEEPLAAFYAWLAKHERNWQKDLRGDDLVLVCDIGGGTTDFSLIQAQDSLGRLSFQRMAVGRHLLLGGDNLDAAIACWVEQELRGIALSSLQHLQLLDQARRAKEALLGEARDRYTVAIQGTGSRVVGGSRSLELEGEKVRGFLLEGFFGSCSWEEALKLKRASGIRGMGLPYEDDPSITKHLASFLHRAASQMEGFSGPTHVLFNGGTMRSPLFQRAILDNLKEWYGRPSRVLESPHLELAVAQGAAYYGRVRRGLGVKVKCGLPRSYYLGVETEEGARALTLMERGIEEGEEFIPEPIFHVRPNTPVTFKLYSSDRRLGDHRGDLVTIDEESMSALAPIHTSLRYGRGGQGTLPVRLHAKLSTVGVLEIWLDALESPHRWELEFQLRSASGQEDAFVALGAGRKDETFDVAHLDGAKEVLKEWFRGNLKPAAMMKALEESLDTPRSEWVSSTLRGLWAPLLEGAEVRRLSPDHAARWWHLAGFFLRPGYGYPLDDHRIRELWRHVLADYRQTENLLPCAIAFRRVAGGLSKGQQVQLWNHLFPLVIDPKVRKSLSRDAQARYSYGEWVRTLASFERVDPQRKAKLGEAILKRWQGAEPLAAELWAMGRLGARQLMVGSPGDVVPREEAERWLRALLDLKQMRNGEWTLALRQLARVTDQRELNLSPGSCKQVEDLLGPWEQPTGKEVQDQIFGEQLPAGLLLICADPQSRSV